MDSISASKREVRRAFLNLRESLSPEYTREADRILFEKAVNCECYIKAETILAYYPIRKEPNILPIVCHALASQKRVAFPVSNKDSSTLTFRYVGDISELSVGAYSIFEPTEDAPEYIGGERVLCIVPALAFDRRGKRIGYGKGYYDRFLSKFKGESIGLCYSDFFVDELPVESTDISVDMIISDKEELFVNVK